MSTTPIISVSSAAREGVAVGTPGHQTLVFTDRDGVLNTMDGFVNSPEDLDRQLLPGAVKATARLKEAGIGLVVVTNQGGVGEHHMTDEQNRAILGRLADRVDENGGHLEAIYYCPNAHDYHPPAGEADARKGDGGMFLAAARDFGRSVDLADCYMIGDMTTDIQAARAACPGLIAILVETGAGGRDGRAQVAPDKVCRDFSQAVEWIVARERTRG